MNKNNDISFNNVQHGSYEDFLVSQDDNNIRNKNEKREDQDVNKYDIKDSHMN